MVAIMTPETRSRTWLRGGLVIMCRLSLTSLLLLSFLACAVNAVTPSREAYILAHEHGYLEIRVVDTSVQPEPSDDPTALPVPPTCYLEVTANREPLLEELVYATGESPPFAVDVGFRAPLSAKEHVVHLEYTDCRGDDETAGGSADTAVKAALTVQIHPGMVTELLFDGDSLSLAAVRQDTAPTLARVLEQLEAKND